MCLFEQINEYIYIYIIHIYVCNMYDYTHIYIVRVFLADTSATSSTEVFGEVNHCQMAEKQRLPWCLTLGGLRFAS